MNPPFPDSPQDSTPPLSDKAGDIAREPMSEAAARAAESARIRDADRAARTPDVVCCHGFTRFVQDRPCAALGIVFGLGLVAGWCAAQCES